MLVVDGAEGGDGGGQSARQQLGRLPVVLRLGPQQGDNVLQVAGRLQAQSVHHVTQVVCGEAETGGSAPQRQNPELTLSRPENCTDVRSQLFGGARAELGDEQDDVTVGLHGRPGNGAQPVVGGVVQLREVVAWDETEGDVSRGNGAAVASRRQGDTVVQGTGGDLCRSLYSLDKENSMSPNA